MKRERDLDEASKKHLLLHVAGATVRHQNPFENMLSHQNDVECDNQFIKKWVVPVYLAGLSGKEETLLVFKSLMPQLTHEILLKMLGEFGWRQRIAGAYFAAISKHQAVEDVIGTHLLKSEVCYAGRGYCLALASFETITAQKYLIQYLEYYLSRSDLDFDQSSALGALAFLDPLLGSSHASKLRPTYDVWQQQRSHRRKAEDVIEYFRKDMARITTIRSAVSLVTPPENKRSLYRHWFARWRGY